MSAEPIGADVNASEHRTTVVLPGELHERLVERARDADRSLSAEIRCAVRSYIATSSAAHPDPSLRADHRVCAALDADDKEER